MNLTDEQLEILNDLWVRDDYDGAVDLVEAIVAPYAEALAEVRDHILTDRAHSHCPLRPALEAQPDINPSRIEETQ